MSSTTMKGRPRPDRARSRPSPGREERPRHPWAAPFFFVTALAVPLVYSNATIDPVLLPDFLVVSALGIVFFTAFGVRALRTPATLSLNRAEAIVLGELVAFILVAAITLRIAGATPDGNFELLKLATFAWLVFVTSRAIDAERSTLALLARFVTIASFIVGGFAVLQYYQVAIFEWMKVDTTVDSTMGHRNLLSSFVAMALPFVAYVFLEVEGSWRIAAAVTMFISFFLLVALQTRSVWVAFPVGLAFSAVVLAVVAKRAPQAGDPRRAYRPRLIQGALLAVVGLCLALLFSSPASRRAPMAEHAASVVEARDASARERLQLWSRTIRMIRDHPLTGVGLGNWRIVIPTYGAEGLRSDTGTIHFQRPHNDLLWVASETGILGGVLYLAVFASVVILAVFAMVRASKQHDRVVLALMLLGVSCYFLDSLLSFPKERVAHSVYLALLIGTVLSFYRGAGERTAAVSLSNRWTRTLALLLWVTAVVAGRFAWSRTSAEVHLRRALEARAVQNWPEMVAQLDHIDRRYYVIDPSSAPVAWYRGVAHFEMGDTTAAMADFRRAQGVHPNHVHVLNNIATCQTLRGDFEDAVRNYERAIELAPRFEEARTNLGALLHRLGKDQQAYEVLEPAAGYATSPRFTECLRVVKEALGMQK